ncbi:MAG: NAD(P)-dependent glycerol-3-phosphate dehydrogenase [Candidatus Omnitrophica bacterium]|nr:NAD(P)-dependent glycerol-3-phosphate dehydrogenase [Candidatus Omnitrophota bacterium]MCB9766744.1 NAD(P)-dependent glycerol-3-phosphate dehydrogenase [Candidatus Omnitrophota bacterium]MCB9784357.1 NAD(P)-dependent glycerol-3-phosphate dehydrogenase [Candidatus Omnitrophota bacterium]
MIQTPEKILVLGAGSWGGALCKVLHQNGNEVRLWEIDRAEAKRLEQERTLPGKLDEFKLPEGIQVGSNLGELVEDATALVFVVPSQFFRSTARSVKEAYGDEPLPDLMISCTKGLEQRTFLTMTGVLEVVLGVRNPVALSGPSHAEEVAMGLPTTVTVASMDHSLAERAQTLFNTPTFRVYTAEDPVGVQLGGALKNVIAIAAGAASGMGFGDNTMAALVTRGLAEISRLGIAMGADPLTFAGLSGMGDLIVTCASHHSRNRRMGIALAQGKTLDQGLKEIGMAVEGVETAKSIRPLVEKYRVEMPICEQVARTLFDGVPATEAVKTLMLREPKPERVEGA